MRNELKELERHIKLMGKDPAVELSFEEFVIIAKAVKEERNLLLIFMRDWEYRNRELGVYNI